MAPNASLTATVAAQLAALSEKGRRRVEKLVARSQQRSARLRWNSTLQGTYRNPMRELRRALLAEHCARTGNRPTGRQWVRLRKRLQREHNAHARDVAQGRAA
jgi:hypothetical protein